MKPGSATRQTGFTIVELLIVIVVIAILATISVVAYSGIQNRANDTAIQADLNGFAGKIAEYHAINGQYPTGVIALGGGSGFGPISGMEGYPFSRASYSTGVNNIYYCEAGTKFAVGAGSKSGNRYYYRSDGGLAPYTGTWTDATAICPGMLGTSTNVTYSYAFRAADGAWSAVAK